MNNENPQTQTGNSAPPAPKTGFSWMGLLFNGLYYIGYGNWKKGLLMTALAVFIPGGWIPAGIWAGICARKDLPIGQQPFAWLPTIGIFAGALIVASLWINLIFNLGGVPGCGSTNVKDLTRQIAYDNWQLELIDLDNIEEKAFDADRGVRACSGTMVTTGQDYDINYSVKLRGANRDQVEVRIEVVQ